MLSNLLIITNNDVETMENDGKGYCLIIAFFQGLYSEHGTGRLQGKEKLISDAMKLVVDNEELAREVLSEDSKKIIATWYTCYNNILGNEALKKGSFWNYEILEFYIEISQLKVQLYYFREFLPKQYVLLKTRNSMERKEDFKVVAVLELLSNKHKISIQKFKVRTAEELSDNTNFNLLIDAKDAVNSPSYDVNTFISLNICKRVIVTNDATCGYASIAKCIGKNSVYVIEQLSEYYLHEFQEKTNNELFSKGKNLSDWLTNSQSQEPFPENLSLTSDDGMFI